MSGFRVAAVSSLFVALLVGLTVLTVVVTGNEKRKCEAAGGSYELDYYIPISTGKTTTLSPVYECVGPR